MLRALNVVSFNRNANVFAQIHNPHNKGHVMQAGIPSANILCMAETKLVRQNEGVWALLKRLASPTQLTFLGSCSLAGPVGHEHLRPRLVHNHQQSRVIHQLQGPHKHHRAVAR